MTISLRIGNTPNNAVVTVGSLRLHFSYQTVIAFFGPDDAAIRVNDWSTTTGKHLNAIDGGSAQAKKDRVPGAEFEARLAAQMEILGL